MNTCNAIGIQDVSELPVDTFTSVPDYFMGIREVIDEQSGNVLSMPVRVPGNAVLPNGTNANVFPLDTNNSALTVPEGQVLACYLQNAGYVNRILPADNDHPADFLVLGVNEAGVAQCQSTGVAFIPTGHEYDIIAAQYYQNNGVISTQSGGQKLFKPISKYELLINL